VVNEGLKLSGLSYLDNYIVLRLDRFQDLLADIMLDIKTLLLIAILVEFILGFNQPFVYLCYLIIYRIKLLPLLFSLGYDEAKVIFGAFYEVLDALLLGLDLFHSLNDVNYDLLSLIHFLFEQSPLKLAVIIFESVKILGIFVDCHFLIWQLNEVLLLFVALPLDHIKLNDVDILVDDWLIHG
jgi:hypothetical protein